MLTDRQKETFKDLKEGKLTPKQKADFYYRMSNILKDYLEGIEDVAFILNEIPASYLEKVNLIAAATFAMNLTEKLTEMLDPSPFASRDAAGKYHTYRHFRVDMSGELKGLTQTTADIEVVYEPTEEEVLFFRQLIYHITKMEEIYRQNERPNEVFTYREYEKKVASIVKGRPHMQTIVGVVGSPTEETAKSIMDGKPLVDYVSDLNEILTSLKDAKKKESPK
jgi:hypothetical protein